MKLRKDNLHKNIIELRCFHKSLSLFRNANQLRASDRVLSPQYYQHALSISSNVFARTFNERCRTNHPQPSSFHRGLRFFYAKILIARQALQRSGEK